MKRINLDTPIVPDAQRIRWLNANSIDASTVPAAQEVAVDAEARTITFVRFVLDERGHKLPPVDGHGYPKELVTVPLIADPERYGL